MNESASSSHVLPLDSPAARLAVVGGKGANLAFLARAGLPVPGGFLATTTAYRDFVVVQGLERGIMAALPPAGAGPQELEGASANIRGRFDPADMPATLAESLIHAVVSCWSSLWTARAIGYRLRRGMPSSGLALAVVVQRMVQSEPSGVMFTANPLTGQRSEIVIEAILGLGEALVSGMVEPDKYIVDAVRGEIRSVSVGSKAISIRGRADGGTTTVTEAAADRRALTDSEVLALSGLGRRLAQLYGSPQDIEWARAEGRIAVLQSRAITSLFPLPLGMSPRPLQVMFSFAAVQGLRDPLTPLGRDFLLEVFATAAGLCGYRVSRETQRIAATAGERLWINITPLLRATRGRRVALAALGFVEPTVRQALSAIMDEPRLLPAPGGIRRRTIPHLARALLPMAANVLRALAEPNGRRRRIVERGEQILQHVDSMCASTPLELEAMGAMIPDVIRHLLPRMLVLFVSAVASGMAAFNAVRVLSRSLGSAGSKDMELEITRAVPHNPITEMDLALWGTAQEIRRDAASREALMRKTSRELADEFHRGSLPTPAAEGIARFLRVYGSRGLAELDAGRMRWNEDPAPVFESIAAYMKIGEGQQAAAPDAVFERGRRTAEAAGRTLISGLRRTPGGRRRAALARLAVGRMRALMGVRESPKFFVVRLLGILRRKLLEIGATLVEKGVLCRVDDPFYLTLSELASFGGASPQHWRELIALRRHSYERELLRRQVPRLLLSDGRAFYEGLSETGYGAGSLRGSPVSPGAVEGPVRIVMDPRRSELRPGEIMVCPGTDPSWTPLFLIASGLVMEVGGMMTHGAVVAREYGIPAVVGVHGATSRLQDGQCIRVDGSTGRITLLDGAGAV